MSASLQRLQHFENRRPARLFAGLLYLVLYSLYLIWRVTIFNMDSIVLSSLFYLMDSIGFFLGILLIVTAYTGRQDYPKNPAPTGLTVDVFIPTYKEPATIIKKTIEAAIAIDYPHKTFVLDDGNRPEIKEIAKSLGAIYRARGKNINAKAGNLNYGLTHSKADYIAVFDADHIPQRQALDKLLAFAGDKKVAMVQTPQDYYNINALQYIDGKKNRTLWSEQSFFYNTLQVCNNACNAASAVGSGVVYLRKAIDDIGGIPEETLTEDLHTSLRLQKAGWGTKYISEPVAYGLAAADITEYYTTRRRWTHGNVQAICREKVLFCKELTWRQKLAYLRMGLISLEGFQQLLMGIIPPISLLFGLQPFDISPFNVLVILFFPLAASFLLQEFSGGRFWPNVLISKLLFPILISSSLAVFGYKMSWKSSAKNIKGQINYKLLWPQISLGIVNVFAVIFGIWRLYPDFKTGPIVDGFVHIMTMGYFGESLANTSLFALLKKGYTVDLVLIAGFWALFNALGVAMLVRMGQKKAWRSEDDYLFQVEFPVELLTQKGEKIYATTKRCSTNHMEFTLVGNASAHNISFNNTIEAKLYTPSGNFPILISSLQTVKKDLLKSTIQWVNQGDKEKFEKCLYSISWHHGLYHYQGTYSTPLENLVSTLKLKEKKTTPVVKPLLIKGENDAKMSLRFAALKVPSEYAEPYTLTSFNTLNIGDKIEAEDLSQNGVKQLTIQVRHEHPEEKKLFINKNLDGVIVRQYSVDIT